MEMFYFFFLCCVLHEMFVSVACNYNDKCQIGEDMKIDYNHSNTIAIDTRYYYICV